MKKNLNYYGVSNRNSNWRKLLLTMKLTVFFLFCGVLNLIASSSYSQNTKISLNMKDASIESVLNKIEDESEFYFLFNHKLIDVERKVDVVVENKTIKDILSGIFADNVDFIVSDRQIVLTPIEKLSISEEALSQQQSLTGTVTDASTGEPMPGVNITIKGSTNGTLTNTMGKYSIDLPYPNAVLVISFIGYQSKEIVVAGQTVIDVSMQQSIETLKEVVVIGYGSIQKQDLTGSVASIKGDVITERKATQISQALQGAVSGVMVTRESNSPGSAASIRVRGVTTIGDSNPLIIVDGIPVDDINSVNPNDVESISVLKDAASSSIYGSRAAAGVILITTKRAKKGDLGMSYNLEFGIEKPTKMPDYVNVVRFMESVNELRWNDTGNLPGGEYPTYPKELVENYYDLHSENPDLYPNTDWRGLIMNNNAPRQSHLLNISGGTDVLRTKVSLGYDKINALYDNKTFERITTRVNNDITIAKNLSATVDFDFNRTISKQPFNTDPWYKIGIQSPQYAAQWSDGRVAGGKDGANIYGILKYGGFNNTWSNLLSGKMSLNYSPIDGLKISAVVSPVFGNIKTKGFRKSISYTPWDNPNIISGYLEGHTETSLGDIRDDYSRITNQLLVNYAKSMADHNLNALAGYEYFYAFNEDLMASRGQYSLSTYPYLDLGPLQLRDNSGNAYENAYRSFFGRFMYNYKSKYYLQGNIRYDGSSRFHKDYRWGAFPSVSIGWVISRESFMKNITNLSLLKLRASYGTLGNERIGNYPYQNLLLFGTSSLFYKGNDIVSAQSAAQAQYSIQNISWEKTQSFDIGLDISLFKDKLLFTWDYYKKITSEMLLPLEIPDYIGLANPNQNTGEMYTNGWEFELIWNDQLGKIDYSISFNLSDFKSTMGNLGGTEFIGDQIKKEGSEFNEWYGYLSDGLFQTQTEVNNSPKTNPNVKPGDVKFKDISGPDGVPDGKISPEYDRTLLGGSLPRYIYGGNIQIRYRNFDLSMVIQGVGKSNARLTTTMIQPFLENHGNFPAILDGNSWSFYNTSDQNLNVRYPRYTVTSRDNNYTMSDFWLLNGAYFRMKNITLSYSIPKTLAEKFYMQGLRLYTSISDCFTINKYPKGWDPEMSSTVYPITTSFVFGLSFTF